MTNSYERMGRPELPQWWIDEFHLRLDASASSYAELARAASEHVGRKSSWTGSAVSKFKNGEAVTWEFALGISHALDMLPPVFVARTAAEAASMLVVARRHDSPSELDHETVRRAGRVAQALEDAVKEAVDQTKVVGSSDEGSPRGRGHRRASRGG